MNFQKNIRPFDFKKCYPFLPCGFDVEDASRYLFFNVVNHCQSNDTSLREKSTKTSIFLESTLDCPLMVF